MFMVNSLILHWSCSINVDMLPVLCPLRMPNRWEAGNQAFSLAYSFELLTYDSLFVEEGLISGSVATFSERTSLIRGKFTSANLLYSVLYKSRP